MDGSHAMIVSQDYKHDYHRLLLRFNRVNSDSPIRAYMESRFARRCGIGSPIYLASVLQYLTQEILLMARVQRKMAGGAFCIYNNRAIFQNKPIDLAKYLKNQKLCKKYEKKLRQRLDKCRKQGKLVSHQKRLNGKIFGKGRNRYR